MTLLENFLLKKQSQIHQNLLNSKFTPVNNQIPNFIPSASIENIFLSGKTNSILRLCNCPIEAQKQLTLQTIQKFSILESAAIKSSTKFVQHLQINSRLTNCFHVIHNVFLFAPADWLVPFYHEIKKEMKHSSSKINLSKVENCLFTHLPHKFSKNLSIIFDDDLLFDHVKRIHSISPQNPYG